MGGARMTARDAVTYQHAFLGSCTECGDRMVEYAATTGGEYRTIQLDCEDESCENFGHVRHESGTSATETPEIQEGVEDLRVGEVHWIDCPRCHGYGWIEDPFCDLSAVMNGRDTACLRCHTSGSVLGDVRDLAE